MKSSKPLAIDPSAGLKSLPSLSPTPLSPTPETFKKSQERWDSIASQFGLPLSSELTGLPPVAFPSFPTVKELATSTEATSSTRPTGLFEELLQSRPEAIYIDLLDHPEKFEDGVKELVEELVARPRALSDKERDLMNRAVLDFVAKPKDKPRAPAKKPEVSRLGMDETLGDEDLATLLAGDAGDDDAPIAASSSNGEPAPFWWV